MFEIHVRIDDVYDGATDVVVANEVETKELNDVLRRLAEHWTSILKNPKLKTGIGQTTRITSCPN